MKPPLVFLNNFIKGKSAQICAFFPCKLNRKKHVADSRILWNRLINIFYEENFISILQMMVIERQRKLWNIEICFKFYSNKMKTLLCLNYSGGSADSMSIDNWIINSTLSYNHSPSVLRLTFLTTKATDLAIRALHHCTTKQTWQNNRKYNAREISRKICTLPAATCMVTRAAKMRINISSAKHKNNVEGKKPKHTSET